MPQGISTALILYDVWQPYLPRRRLYPTKSISFLDIPRELRDKIYELALISKRPISAYDGDWQMHYIPEESRGIASWHWISTRIYWHKRRHATTIASLEQLTPNILFCNKFITREASAMFYRKNTFSFINDHDWDVVVDWLIGIGEDNRSALRKLEIDTARPDTFWRYADGKMHPTKDRGSSGPSIIYPQHPYLISPPGPVRSGAIDVINPRIEDLFILLGMRESEKEVKVVLKLNFGICPGAEVDGDTQGHESGWFGLDLPNLIETFRVLHTSVPGLKAPVEVIWEGEAHGPFLVQKSEVIEEAGWNLTLGQFPPFEEGPGFGTIKTKFFLKRKKIEGPSMAQGPSPYSHDYGRGDEPEI